MNKKTILLTALFGISSFAIPLHAAQKTQAEALFHLFDAAERIRISTYNTPDISEDVRFIVSNNTTIVNASDDSGVTPLMLACRLGNLETTKILISAGAEINTIDKDGNTALFYALDGGNADVVNYLVSIGAATEIKNADNRSPEQTILFRDLYSKSLFSNEKYEELTPMLSAALSSPRSTGRNSESASPDQMRRSDSRSPEQIFPVPPPFPMPSPEKR